MYTEQFEKYGFVPMNHDKPNYFQVLTEPMVGALTNAPVACAKRLYNERNGDTLSVMSADYRVIQDEEVFGAFEAALNQSHLDIGDLMIHRDRSHDGAQMFCQYVLPNVTEDINGTNVSLRFLVWNGHNGRVAMNGRAGFFTWVCANQSVLGEDMGAFRVVHRGEGSDIFVEIKTLVDGAANAHKLLQDMKRWTQIPVLDATAIEVFKALPGSSKSLVADMNMEWTNTKGMTSHPNGGDSVWALHNVLTGWATHGEGRAKNVANQRMERQKRVAQLQEGKLWKQLVSA